MVNDFYLRRLDIARLNYGVVTLIPKVHDANNVKQYRPICLLNVSFKTFTKLIMGRLTRVAKQLISPSQTAFIKDRFILDGAVILHEVIHELHSKKMSGVILKIDFEKAYDSINWNFVEEVMIRKGFSETLRGWIMDTVKGGRVCININGQNGPYFKTHRGLRQAVPPAVQLSSGRSCTYYGQSKKPGVGKRGGASLGSLGITHLQYADDTVDLTEN